MTWDPIKKFESLEAINENIFKRIANAFSAPKQNKIPALSDVEKARYNQLLAKYKRGVISDKDQKLLGYLGKISDSELAEFNKLNSKKTTPQPVIDYAASIESGSECKKYGTKPNNKFWSEIGSMSAKIGPTGFVDDISDFDFTKGKFRCYDIDKDPLKIAWLYKGEYEAEKIWGTPKQVYFKGIWKGGDFKGIMAPGSKFEGGEFNGKCFKGDSECLANNTASNQNNGSTQTGKPIGKLKNGSAQTGNPKQTKRVKKQLKSESQTSVKSWFLNQLNS